MFSHIKELFTRPSGYNISRSVRLRSSASAYFNRTPASAGSQTTWTLSFWVKRGLLSASGGGYLFSAYSGATNSNLNFYFDTSDQFRVVSDGTNYRVTTPLYRDPASWYHIVVTADTTNATAQSRLRIYVNGVEVTAWAANTTITQNQNLYWNGNWAHAIGRYANVGSYFDGYLTEINFIDGQALTPSSFGETDAITGVWKAKKYAGTYGTNGFYLNFSDNSNNTAATIGKDYSGNGNNWTPNNISVTSGSTYDSMLDVPTPYADGGNGRGNYCVLNPLNNVITLSDGNLKGTTASASWNPVISTFGVSSGKWYWEYTVTGNNDVFFGISPSTYTATSGQYPGSSSSNGYGYYGANGNKYNLGAGGTAYGASVTTNDVVGVALDMDAGTLTFYKNNTSQGVAASSITGTWMPAMAVYNNNAVINFGQRPFTYTPPSGFVALNTQNLPDSTIKNGAAYMAATTYTGTGSTQSITNTVGSTSFQPDFVWMKSRSAATSHHLADSVRGIGSTSYLLLSNTTDAESTSTTNITAVTSTGFTVGSSTAVNNSGATYVAWQWKAGGSSSSNTNGSITSTVSVGATQGFSVVTYTGTGANATVGHGLGVAPSMIIVKMRSAGGNNWQVYHSALGQNKILQLDLTTSVDTITNYWYNGTTSTVFGVNGSYSGINSNGATYVAYCFSAVKGFSAFGSYTANASADGPFIYTGFRPRWIMIKSSSAVVAWIVWDSSRNTYNVSNSVLQPNVSDAEATAVPIDIVSNGFKIRTTDGAANSSTNTYIYACFAESPFKTSLAR